MSLSARVRVDRGAFTLDVGLEVPDGQVVAVLGPNGAGKTTLLRVLAGLHPLTSGTVDLGGAHLEDTAAARRRRLPPPDRRVGVVFSDHRLFPHLSARDNVAFGPRSVGAPRVAARATADAWLGRLGVDDLADRRPDQLSGGQAQRVALARTLATDPDLLLLDEPLAALDATTRDVTRRVLGEQLAVFDGPVLLVTHDLLDALVLADRVVVLEAGRVVQDCGPDELTRRPLTAYVAQLVGLNLWNGSVSGGRFTVDAAAGGGSLPVPEGSDDGWQVDGRALAVVSPDAVTLHPVTDPCPTDASTTGAGTSWRARVRHSETHAGRVRVHLDGAPTVTVEVDTRTATRLSLDPGHELTVHVATADVTVYPAQAIGAGPSTASVTRRT